jgi:hypothetical protein
MFRVQLIFDLAHPDSEDQAVRDYLAQHGLEPRHCSTGEVERRHCEVMQFGGCYLGGHLEPIGRMQRRAVEVELLAGEIRRCLDDPQHQGVAFQSPEQEGDAVAALAAKLHRDDAFQQGGNGQLTVSLDGDAVRDAARRWLAEQSER